MVKRLLPHIISIFVIIASISIYFAPHFSGKIVAGGDVVSSTAWSKQVIDYKEETGITSHWNPSMFSGMPWGLLTAGGEYNLIRKANTGLRLFQAPPVGIVLKSGILCYLALILLGVRPWVALFGGLAFAFNVNYIILIEAGHQSKLSVLANFPLLLSGLILCYRERWKLGATAIAFATSIAISNNHIQMVYYLLICFVIIGLVYLVQAIRTKTVSSFFKMSGIAMAAAIIGGLSNFSMLASASSFSEDTMRGKPILESAASAGPSSSSTTKGLEWNYAMQWSNESKDLMSVFVPRIVGGSSYEEVSGNSELGRLLQANNGRRGADNTYQAPTYWGSLPITSGPYYSSMVLFSLFILSFFLVPVRLRWALGIASLFIMILSMGRHAEWINKPMFDLLPLLNKFRAPSSAITILPLFLVFGGSLGLHHLLSSNKRENLVKPVLFGAGGVVVLTLLLTLLGGSMLSFEGPNDASYQEQVRQIIVDARAEMFSSDAWRSLGFSVAVFVLLFAYAKNYLKSGLILSGVLCALVFADLYSINKRHLDADNWESKREYSGNFELRPADKQIMEAEPKGRGYYRVFDIPNMRTSVASYHHNTIGGYHAAKLQRYQDMLDYHINKGSRNVLNMLNAKYTITPQQKVERNPGALGNAWSVREVRYVNSANEEIESVSGVETGVTAIVNQTDFPNAKNEIKTGSGNATIQMTDYAPNKWVYDFNSTTEEFVLFSEVWYDHEKGMTAKIDGNEVDFVRANYILRGLQVPAGKHTIEFFFKPKAKAAGVSIVASILILMMLLYNILAYFGKLPPVLQFEGDRINSTVPKAQSSETLNKPKKKKRKKKK